jgi:hypothetical protein
MAGSRRLLAVASVVLGGSIATAAADYVFSRNRRGGKAALIQEAYEGAQFYHIVHI